MTAGHAHHKVCFVNAVFSEIKFSGWWPRACQNNWFYICCADKIHPSIVFLLAILSSAILRKLICTSNKALLIVTKVSSYFKLCHLLALSGNFGCVFPESPIYMLLSEISQEGSNSVSLLSNAAHQKFINLDFFSEQLTFFKDPKISAETMCVDAIVDAASKQLVSEAPSCSTWCHYPFWA